MKNVNLANGLTSLRLLGAVILLFLAPMALPFYVVYSVCGLTDALDGFAARVQGTASPFGARLDSVADLSFYSCMVIKLLPVLWTLLPMWFWWWAITVGVLRVVCYIVAAFRFHQMASLHTILNKATGLMIFAIPYLLITPWFLSYCAALGAVASAATLQELYIHFTRKAPDPSRGTPEKI